MTRARQLRLTCLAASFPALAVMLLQAWPLGLALQTAFGTPEGGFTLEHARQVIGAKLFQRAVCNSLLIPLLSVLLEGMLGLALALWFHELRRGKAVWRTLAILPFAVPEIVYLLTMKMVFRQHGYLNSILHGIGGEDWIVSWLEPGSPLLMPMIILIDAWRVTPVVFLIVLAGLEQLPASTLEAARIDGTGWWRLIVHVKLPLILPTLMVALALRAIDAFRIFATPLVLVGIEPLPMLSTVAYHYRMDRHDAAAANIAALILAAALLAGLMAALVIASARRKRIES